jgi:hypothetical protein
MKNTDTLYLIGPGSSISDFSLEQLGDNPTLTFSGTLDWFYKNNIYPSYWCFIDPYTVVVLMDSILKSPEKNKWANGLKDHTTLLYNHFQGTPEFYSKGLTTSQGLRWCVDEFGGKIFPSFKTLFKEAKSLHTKVATEDYGLLFGDLGCPLIKHCDKFLNSDKFTSYVLPLVIYYFTNLKNIVSVGFGDYNQPRAYTTNSHGYEGFIKSYNILGPLVKKVLEKKKIGITFINKESHYINLENE